MQYFLEYSKVNKSQLDTYAKVLELGSVLLPGKSSIKTNGTVLRVNDKHQITEIISGTIDAGLAVLSALVSFRRGRSTCILTRRWKGWRKLTLTVLK